MSHSARTAPTPAPEQEIVLPEVHVVDRKSAVVFAVLTVGLAITLLFGAQDGDTSFRLAAPDDFVRAAHGHRAVDGHRLGPHPGVRPLCGPGRVVGHPASATPRCGSSSSSPLRG